MIVTGFLHLSPIACLAAATDCEGVERCIFGTTMGCTLPSATAFCADNHADHCLGTVNSGEDCSQPGALRDGAGTCTHTSTGNVICGFGTCDPTGTPQCDGGVALTCDGGILNRWTCPKNTTCAATSDSTGDPSCVGSGAPCTSNRCDGSDLQFCLHGGEVRLPCHEMQVPSICAANTQGTLECAPNPDLACDPLHHADHCDGPRIVYCDGDQRTVDCRFLGFSSCESVGEVVGCR